jgi:LmbE family N-acetylglucosaminyl deacetylase
VRRRTLVGVWAHPDDEAYLSAGLMAECRRNGDRVVVVTATLGEHGTSDPEAWPPARLAVHREGELRAALAAVDVHELRLLGYEDGDCGRHDGTDVVAEHLAELEPDLVVTFGPDGMTGHPDHRAISRWTTDACATACPTADLWYATLAADFHRTWGGLNDEIGLWADQPEPPSTETVSLVHNLRLRRELLDRKIAALEAHASQTGPLIELVGRPTYRRWWNTESFRRAEAAAALTG